MGRDMAEAAPPASLSSSTPSNTPFVKTREGAVKQEITRTAIAAVLAVGFACAGGEAGPQWEGSVTDSAGIQLVENPATGLWDETTRWSLTEELRIGSAEGDLDYQFGSISGIVVGNQGNIFVLDQQAAEIKVYDPSGTYLRTIGKAGGGPGEIGALGGGALLDSPGDTLSVADMRNMRVQHFLEGGAPAGNYRIDMTQGIPLKWQESYAGNAVVQTRPMQFGPNQPAPVDSMDMILVRNTSGTPVDTLLKVPAGGTFKFAGGTPEFHLFAPEPMWSVAPDGAVWYGVNNTYDIGLYTDGMVQRRIRKTFRQEPVTEASKTTMVEALKSAMVRTGQVPPQAVDQLLSQVTFEDYLPVYRQFFSGPGNSLWVQHMQSPADMTESDLENMMNPQAMQGSPTWDVFDAEGRFLGSLDMPARFQPLRFTDEMVYGVWKDDLDVQYLVALRIGTTGDRPVTVDVGGP